MAFLLAALPYITAAGAVAGGIIQAKGQKDAGDAAEAGAYNEAAQLDDEANATKADAQRQAIDERRMAARASSRALAVSAASGAGALDPSVETITSNIEGEGEYRALSRLYNGDAEASNLQQQAAATRSMGNAKKKASRYAAASTILSSGSDLVSKYGPSLKTKPKASPTSFNASAAGDYSLNGSTGALA
jgi:hypothetical protein